MWCTCGHTDEEHRKGKSGMHECEIPDCDCCCFEEGDDPDADDGDDEDAEEEDEEEE